MNRVDGDFVGGRTILFPVSYTLIQIDTTSGAYARMTNAWFWFEADEPGPMFTGTMTCVCGRKERFSVSRDRSRNGKIDVAGLAEAVGAASPRHLKTDGYSKGEILAIRRAFV